MMESQTPREMLKGLLEGALPPRPLFLPIVFSLGARVENVPLRDFLSNPTKIFNSLRRIRAHLRADGVACYFDPYLEAEALGATIDWEFRESGATKTGSPLSWPDPAEKGTLPRAVISPEQAVRGACVAVAVEVIRRLNTVQRDGSILMAGVTGPFTLAARLTGLECEQSLRPEDVPREALEIAASFVTLLGTAFVEAGANLIFIQEDNLPTLSAENCQDWARLLAPTLNITRFYEALPVLYFSSRSAATENRNLIFQRQWDSILCPALDALPAGHPEAIPGWSTSPRALALPLGIFHAEQTSDAWLPASLREAIPALRPAILTTAGDVPAGADMKRLSRVFGEIPRAF
jgi:hypothetical protein